MKVLAVSCAYLMVALLLLGSNSWADVWERNADGEFTLHRSLDVFQRSRLAANWRPPSVSELASRRSALTDLITEEAARAGIEPSLVHSIIEVESAYDVNAVSKAGAIGLMQLMPQTVERFSVIDPLDPKQNVAAGVRYLQRLQLEFHSVELVLAAYNAGEEAVRHYGNAVPPYSETKAYVARVLEALSRRTLSEEGSRER